MTSLDFVICQCKTANIGYFIALKGSIYLIRVHFAYLLVSTGSLTGDVLLDKSLTLILKYRKTLQLAVHFA